MSDGKKELDGVQANETIEAARVAGLLDPDLGKPFEDRMSPIQLDPVFTKPVPIDARTLSLMGEGENRARVDSEMEFDDTGRATTRQRYRDSFSYGHAWPQLITGPAQGNWELARFVVPRGRIGVIRTLSTWADLLGSPSTGPFVPGAPGGLVSVSTPHISLRAPATVMPLPWLATQNFTPIFFSATLESWSGNAPVGDSAFELGTANVPSLDQDDLMPSTVMVGLTAVGANHTVALTGPFPPIAGNSSIFHQLTATDSAPPPATAYATITVWGFLQPSISQAVTPWVSGSPCGIDPFALVRNGIDLTWCLRLHPLNGQIVREVPGFVASNSRPRGDTVEDLYDWKDQRFGFGSSGENKVFLVIPEDHYVSLYLSLIDPTELATAGLWLNYWAGRLQGYTQAAQNTAAVHNVRHGWNW